MTTDIDNEIDRNFDFFTRTVGQYHLSHAGMFALIRQAEIIDFYNSFYDAEAAGELRFDDHIYSIQAVTPQQVQLGYMADAYHYG